MAKGEWWIRIERDQGRRDVMVGPYPDEAMVKVALDNALIIEELMTSRDGGVDCYATQDEPDTATEDVERIDVTNWYDTGAPEPKRENA